METTAEKAHAVDDVARLSVAVGRELDLAHGELEVLMWAAELHDVGKVAIPDAILHKPGPLDEFEWQMMRGHTLVAERIVGAVVPLRAIAGLVRSSHERWDGSGYPDGLAGEEIPLAARIIAVADAWDAMTTDRPYCDGLTHEAALAELEACAGTQFDPAVVAAFERALEQSFSIPG